MPASRRWRSVGPAILLTATSIGAGDILTGSLAGAEAGLAVIWAVPAGVLLKWTLTEGIARWQMATGTTLIEGWVRRLGWPIRWIFFAYLLLFTTVTSGMLASACGVAGAALVPLGLPPDDARFVWGALHALTALVLVLAGGYSLLKRVLAICVGAMFATVTLTALLLAPDWPAVAGGLIPSIPAPGLHWPAGLIGAIGGTMALISYGYWIREEGRTGEQGLRDCRFDITLSYAVIAVFGISVVIIGSRVVVKGQGAELALQLASQLELSLGVAGRRIFLIGFWAAVFSAMLGVWQSLPYLFADSLALGRTGHASGVPMERSRPYRFYLAAMATLPLLLLRWPVKQLQLAFGLTGAMLLPLLALTLLIMNNRTGWVGPEFRATPPLNAILGIALVFFVWLAARSF
jgi:Mn2+/Fe2+ NRAMP family transporter